MAIEIVTIGRHNAALLENVAGDVFDDAIDPARTAAWLEAPGHHMMVAVADGGPVVGMITAMVHRHVDKPTELYIDEVGVDDAWLRQGIGRRLFDAMLAFGKSIGCEESWVGTEDDNVAARALYATRPRKEEGPFVMYLYDL
jgi:aminoglycoside 6'-N-acetyltransferase I